MQFYHYLAAVLLGTSIGASTGIIMSEQKSKADVNELVAFLTGALPQAIRNCLAVTDTMKDCSYVGTTYSGGGRGGGVVTEGTVRKVELLSYGNIPDYYPPLLNDNGKNTKKQKISVLSDYQVTGLVTSSNPLLLSDSGLFEKYELSFNEKYKHNRRRALVAIELTSEGMDSCKSIIDNLTKHPNVVRIAFQGQRSDTLASLPEYPCAGVYGNDVKLNAAGNAVIDYYIGFINLDSSDPAGNGVTVRLIIGQPIKGHTIITGNGRYGRPEIRAMKIVTTSLKEKVMLINYNF